MLLMSLFSFTVPATASPDMAEWSRVNIPTEGKIGNWVLANGSNIQYLTRAIDGTLYCYANPTGTSYTLFKSTDEGSSWSFTGEVNDSIVDIATAPDDADIVYYATTSRVYESTNAGARFTPLSLNPGGAGSGNIAITSIDVALKDDEHIIAAGTRDTDNLQYGGVYTLDKNEPLPGWVDTGAGSYDVYTVIFSPDFSADRQLLAVVTDETDTFVTTKIGNEGWGQSINKATIEGMVPLSTCIAFPDEYEAATRDYLLFMGIDAGSDKGDVYTINGVAAPNNPVATDLNIGAAYGLSNVDITSIDVIGNSTTASILAGAATSAQVYLSTDGGIKWTRSTKEPTGQSKTYVLMAPDFINQGTAYAATSGIESAFSITRDGIDTWNQLSLIDTRIGAGNILDLAVSPEYSRDNTLFMLTFGGKHSLWRSLNGGERWERFFTSALANVDSIKLVEVSPRYSNGSQVVFLAGVSNGNPTIWKSTDNGQSFKRRTTRDPATGDSFTIDTWVVFDDNTLFIGSHDTTKGLTYYTTNSGFFYSDGVEVGTQSLKSIALSPGYSEDGIVLVGNTNGWVYLSSDNGNSYEPLPLDATSPPLGSSINVAFDPEFSSNKTVYVASSGSDNGTYRFIIDHSVKWEKIDSTLPAGGLLDQVVVSNDGTLYANNLKANGGMERSLNPTYSLGPGFETITKGLDDGAKLNGLWCHDRQLWSIDTANTRLMTYIDSLTQPPTLTSPPDKASGTGTIMNYAISDISLDWETLSEATKYQWQLNYNANFSSVPAGFEGETKITSVRLPSLEPSTTYYWRVRATEPALSPWSAKYSFTTSLGTDATAPKLTSPEAGASSIQLKPVFQWDTVTGADGYELLVSAEASLANPVILKIGTYALPSTAWQCDITLDYNTTYYWKVRAYNSKSSSLWSGVSAFTTEPPSMGKSTSNSKSTTEYPSNPSSQLSPPLPPPPSSPSPPTMPLLNVTDWVVFLVGALILIILLLVITMLTLISMIKRL